MAILASAEPSLDLTVRDAICHQDGGHLLRSVGGQGLAWDWDGWDKLVSIAENDKSSIIRPCRFCGTTAKENLAGWRHFGHEFRPWNDTGQACFDLVLKLGMGKFNRLGLAQAAVWAALCEYSHARVS
jgi:YD repeat-containing protein